MSDQLPSLGECCVCRKAGPTVRNIIALSKKTVAGDHRGWGCLVCGLPSTGAVAVLCDECFDKKPIIKFACVGYPYENKRIPIDELTGTHEHDLSKHPDLSEHS